MVPEKKLKLEVQAPEGVSVSMEGRALKVKGPKGEIAKRLDDPFIEISVEGSKVKINPLRTTKKQKRMANTFRAHVRNMLKGAKEGFEYKLKICASHFPMAVGVEGGSVVIKNFLGEKVPRKARILQGVKVAVQGDTVTVSGADTEAVGQTAANIEQAARVTNRDRRIFQDGIWITEKGGKKL